MGIAPGHERDAAGGSAVSYVYAGYGISLVAIAGYAGWVLARARALGGRR